MPNVSYNAFSFLQKKLKARNRPFYQSSFEIPERTTVFDFLRLVGIEPQDVEAVFVNGTVRPMDTLLKDGDRVAMVPPGTPGPYRVLLGIRKKDA